MGVKYVCDRCGTEVPSSEDFYICEVYLARRKEKGRKVELCEQCASDIDSMMGGQHGCGVDVLEEQVQASGIGD